MPSDSIHVIKGVAIIDETTCTRCGACIPVCPMHCIVNFYERDPEGEAAATAQAELLNPKETDRSNANKKSAVRRIFLYMRLAVYRLPAESSSGSPSNSPLGTYSIWVPRRRLPRTASTTMMTTSATNSSRTTTPIFTAL